MSNRPPGFDIHQPDPRQAQLPEQKGIDFGPYAGPDRDVSDGGGGRFMLFLLAILAATLLWILL